MSCHVPAFRASSHSGCMRCRIGLEVNNGTGRYGSGRRSRTSGGMNRANRWRMPAEIAGMLGVLFPFSSDEPWGGDWLQRAL